MAFNISETRQGRLKQRLAEGTPVVAAEVAREFGVSVDTIRRDIIALEAAGQARRVRGGAMPVKAPDAAMEVKIARGADGPADALVAVVLVRIDGARMVLMDGGSTTRALARALPYRPDLLVATPSPWVAVACNARGIEVYLIGVRPRNGRRAGVGRRSRRCLGADTDRAGGGIARRDGRRARGGGGDLSGGASGVRADGGAYALVIPLAFSRAANDPVAKPGCAIASVATLGYGGVLLGPPIIGFVAEAISVRFSFGVVAAQALVISVFAPALAPRQEGWEWISSGRRSCC